MFHVIFTTDSDIECEGNDLYVSNEDFCSESTMDSYLRVYAIILGDFEMVEYRQSTAVTVLWFLLTFFGIIILFNVFIAVVSDSYARSQEDSVLIFRR
jgi:hypothetical protein